MVALVLPAFRTPINNNLKCIFCKNILKKPKQTNCGHRLCHDCLEQRVKNSSETVLCPVDGQEVNFADIFPDRFCERDIQNLECYCSNSTRGCEWHGQLLHFEKHASKCEYSLVDCPNNGCKEKLERSLLEGHIQNTCKFRTITCENCNAQLIHTQKEAHLAVCPKVKVNCTAGCGEVVTREDLEDHVTKHCVNTPIACPFEQSGCNFKGLRADVQEHESTEVSKHIKILGNQGKESSENFKKIEEKMKIIESEKEQLVEEMRKSREALAYTRQDLQIHQSKIGNIEKTMTKQKEELKKLKEVLDNIKHETGSETPFETQMAEIISLVESQEKRIGDLSRDLIQGRENAGLNTSYIATNSMASEIRLERNENMFAMSEARINQHDIRLQMLEATSYDGTYIWKIDDWNQRVRDAKIGKTTSIYSPPFYVGRYGYKVCGRLYPCGDGIGKDTHLSLFFVVMKGEYDALLSWPFTQKVTFRLIDANHVRDAVDSFRPDPKSSSFQRPKSAMNIASGTPQFVSQTEVNNRGFVVEDTLYIKITVDRTGLREI